MEPSEKNIAQSIINSNANNGVVSNVLNTRTGQSITRSACAYIGSLNKDLKRLAGLDNLSSSDKIIDFFKEKKYDYISLYNNQNRFPGQTPLVSDNYLSTKSIYSHTNFVIPPFDMEDAEKYTCDTCASNNLTKD